MKALLAQLAAGSPLTRAQAVAAFESIMTGQADAAQVGALLGMIQVRGPSIDEIAGAASVMRAKATPVAVPDGMTVIDTCGTGGDGGETFNISTAAALVVAGAGHRRGVGVAKHGNRAVTSKSGSSQVLEALGVRLEATPATLTQCLADAGVCFCYAPNHHPAMRHAAPIRQALGFRTLFNLLGPLTNPAGAARQVLGVFANLLTEPLAQVLGQLGSKRAMVVHGKFGQAGLDEVSTGGPTRISELKGGLVATHDLDASRLGLPVAELAALRVAGPDESAAVIRAVLAGEPGPARDIVCLNAAAGLVVADLAGTWAEGLALAREAVDRGDAARALATLAAITRAGGAPAA